MRKLHTSKKKFCFLMFSKTCDSRPNIIKNSRKTKDGTFEAISLQNLRRDVIVSARVHAQLMSCADVFKVNTGGAKRSRVERVGPMQQAFAIEQFDDKVNPEHCCNLVPQQGSVYATSGKCGHICCEVCLISAMRGTRVCPAPSCGKVLAPEKHGREAFVARHIDKLALDCPNVDCHEPVSVENLREHLDVCSF
jgi:hypothetical protein